MMRALIESAEAAVALTVSVLSNASVPAKTREPTVFDAGIDSPVIIDSSMEPAPSSTIPSNALARLARCGTEILRGRPQPSYASNSHPL